MRGKIKTAPKAIHVSFVKKLFLKKKKKTTRDLYLSVFLYFMDRWSHDIVRE
jgi:hypothetical protein